MKSRVFVIKTSPQTVLDDYAKIIKLAISKKDFDPRKSVVLKLNLSWTKFYPACSSPPWQVEGVIKSLLQAGWTPENIIPLENQTVVTDVKQGATNHFWTKILDKYGIKMHYLTEKRYIKYKPGAKMIILDKIFPRGVFLPKLIINKPLISLCTMKTHVFTTTTGAIKNYFGMLNIDRHFAHRFIHQTLVDLLAIQQELHPQILGIMDGTIVGSGPGPRAMAWHQKDYLLASNDLVSLDSIAAKMMGFNPLKIDYLRLSHEKKLGLADPKNIKVNGENIDKINFGFKSADTFASRGQKLIYRHLPLWLEKILLQTFIAPWSHLASRLYFDIFWYNFIGRYRLKKFFASPWGWLFKAYSQKA
jgi:uncharacterized protein (DUF362 family)